MGKDVISYRVDDDEMKDLIAEGERQRPKMSADATARERMRSWTRIRKRMEALERLVADQRIALAKACTAILCRAGKETEDRAEKWVRENILAK